MERKQKYNAPVILEEVQVEMEGSILYDSKKVKDVDFQEVETWGQQIVPGDRDPLVHEWK